MIGRTADELGVAVEGVNERPFQLEFAGDGLRRFFDEGHNIAPFRIWLGYLRLFLTADETPGAEFVPLGGSDPTNLLGGSTSQKVGSLPPMLRVLSAVFFHAWQFVSRSALIDCVGR